MDSVAWIVTAGAIASTLTIVALAPRWNRENRRRQHEGGGGSLAGLGSGWDAVWRPSAGEAHAQWQAQVELPAPAPSPADRGRLGDDPLVIDVRTER